MEIKDKLRLAINMSQSSFSSIQYDKKGMYHLRDSIKDLEKKWFRINKIEDMRIIEKIVTN